MILRLLLLLLLLPILLLLLLIIIMIAIMMIIQLIIIQLIMILLLLLNIIMITMNITAIITLIMIIIIMVPRKDQYRMHPQIAAFCSWRFYRGELRSAVQGSQGSQGCGLSILRIRLLVPRRLLVSLLLV